MYKYINIHFKKVFILKQLCIYNFALTNTQIALYYSSEKWLIKDRACIFYSLKENLKQTKFVSFFFQLRNGRKKWGRRFWLFNKLRHFEFRHSGYKAKFSENMFSLKYLKMDVDTEATKDEPCPNFWKNLGCF